MSTGTSAIAERAPESDSADVRLMRFLEEQWAAELELRPEVASHHGLRSGDDRWNDFSPDAGVRDLARLKTIAERLAKWNVAELSDEGRLNYELYAARVHYEIEAYELGADLFLVNPRDGVHTDTTLLAILPFTEERNYRALLARIERWPRKVEQTIATLREAITRGRLWPRAVMARVPAMLERLDVAASDHPFFAPFRSLHASIDASVAESLRDAARHAIERDILPAQKRFTAFMHDTYLPAAPEAVGLCNVPEGAALYAYFLRSHTTTDWRAERIHETGLAEVRRIRDAMERLAPATGYSGSLHDVFEAMRNDPANYYDDGPSLLEAYRALAKRIDPDLVALFDPLPREPYAVLAIPGAIAPDTTTAYYLPGSLDGRRPGAMYCNLYQPHARPKYEMAALTLHEAVPGHHLQFALGREIETMPSFRRSAYYVGYSEGWGLYSESLGHDIGLYDEPKAAFGALTYDMWRAVRLVVDTGLHAFGWTRERAITYFLDNAPKTRLDVENEIDRYLTYPGQACAYKIGQLKILELRERAKTKLGDAFDIRAFHHAILKDGSLPLDVLEARFDAWLERNSRA